MDSCGKLRQDGKKKKKRVVKTFQFCRLPSDEVMQSKFVFSVAH